MDKERIIGSSRFAKIVLRSIFGLFVLLGFVFVLFYFSLKIPSVQTWVAGKLTSFASDALNTTITLDRVDIDIHNRLELDGLYVEDLNGDTLVYAQHFETNLAKSLLSVLNKKMMIRSVILEGANVRIYTGLQDSMSNWEEVFAIGQNKATNAGGTKKWNIQLAKIYLKNSTLLVENLKKGRRIAIGIPSAAVIINPNAAQGQLEIKNIDAEGADINIERWATNRSDRVAEQVLPPDDMASPEKFSILIRKLGLRNASFAFWDRDTEPTQASLLKQAIDFRHLRLEDIQLGIDNIRLTNNSLLLRLEQLSAKSNSGFVLDKFNAKQIYFGPKKAALVDFQLKTAHSFISRHINLSYQNLNDFEQFAQKVNLDIQLDQGRLALGEIVHLFPSLAKNEFVKNNMDLGVIVQGRASGTIDKLKINQLKLNIGDDVRLAGDVSIKDISTPNNTRLNLVLERFSSNVHTLSKLLPGFQAPKSIYTVGNFNFKGYFDGFYKDFVAYGLLDTEIGSADLNIKLDFGNSVEEARYSGTLNLIEFDLGKWTSNADIGKITAFIDIKEGRGLTKQSAQALLDAKISSLMYKAYLYKDIHLEGDVNNSVLDGAITSEDENLKFDFAGTLDFSQDHPEYNFKTKIFSVDLRRLNITKKPIIIRGIATLNASDIKPESLEGSFVFRDFSVRLNDSATFEFDSISVLSTTQADGSKKLKVNGDLFDLNVEGQYRPNLVYPSLLRLLQKTYPEFYEQLQLPSPKYVEHSQAQNFDFYLNIKNSKNLSQAFGLSLDTLRDVQLDGYYREQNNEFRLTSYTDQLKWGKTELFGVGFNCYQNGDELQSDIFIDSMSYSGKYAFRAFIFEQQLTQDSLFFNLNTGGMENVVENLYVSGSVFREDSRFALRVEPQDLAILNELWKINPHNKILFDKQFLRAENVHLTNGKEKLYLKTYEDKGIELGTEHFDLDFLNKIWVYDKLDFRGDFFLRLKNNNVFDLEHFELNASMDSLFINDDYYGALDLSTKMKDVKKPVELQLTIDDLDKNLSATGVLIPKGFGTPPSQSEFVDLSIVLDNYPAKMIEYWIGEGVENTKGNVDVDLKIDGTIDDLQMNGRARLHNVETRVIYLGCTYKTNDPIIEISSNFIDATGGELIDKYGNRAKVVGGITHRMMNNLGLDVSLHGTHFLALDTDKFQAEGYYGHAIGDVRVEFTGLIDAPDIRIFGRPTTGTKLFIPLDDNSEQEQANFVVFDHKSNDPDVEKTKKDRFKIAGVNIDMDLEVDNKSEIKIILDEDNVITGRGNGNIKVLLNRSGDFNIYGDYFVESGNYTYSYQDFVPRIFEVQRGGTISWSGDPFNAQMNIKADYITSTSIYSFIEEFFASDVNQELREEARKNQRVKVIMLIDGPLLKPNINFDLEFLNLPTGQLANYINTKVNALQADPNLLNMQVFGLLLTGGFLPESNLVSSIVNADNAFNTVTDFIAGQLSQYVSQLIGSAVTNLDFVSDFNVQLNFRQYKDIIANRNDQVYQLYPEIEFLEGKIVLSGGAYFINSQGVNGTYIANDVKFEYDISSDGQFKVRLYQISDLEFGSRKIELGVGLRYSKEFDQWFGKKQKK